MKTKRKNVAGTTKSKRDDDRDIKRPEVPRVKTYEGILIANKVMKSKKKKTLKEQTDEVDLSNIKHIVDKLSNKMIIPENTIEEIRQDGETKDENEIGPSTRTCKRRPIHFAIINTVGLSSSLHNATVSPQNNLSRKITSEVKKLLIVLANLQEVH